MATTLYPRLDVAASPVLTLPTGYFGTYTQSNSTYGGAGAAALSTTPGAAQSASTSASISVGTAGSTFAIGQFCSPGLAAGTIAAGSWTIGFATAATTGSTKLQIGGDVNIYLINGATGAIRTTIASGNVVVGALSTAGTYTERTHYSTAISGIAATITNGDYILVELVASGKTSSGTSNGLVLEGYTSGTTTIASDGTTTSSSKSFITCPTTLSFASVVYPISASIIQDQSPNVQRQANSLVQLTEAVSPFAAVTRSLYRTITVSQASVAAVTNHLSHLIAVAIVQTQTLSVLLQIGRVVTLTQAAVSGTVRTARSVANIVQASTTKLTTTRYALAALQQASVPKLATMHRSTIAFAQSTVPALRRQARATMALVQGTTSTVARLRPISVSLVQSATTHLAKQYQPIVHMVQGTTASGAQVIVHLISIAIQQAQNIVLQKVAARIVHVSAVVQPLAVRSTSLALSLVQGTQMKIAKRCQLAVNLVQGTAIHTAQIIVHLISVGLQQTTNIGVASAVRVIYRITAAMLQGTMPVVSRVARRSAAIVQAAQSSIVIIRRTIIAVQQGAAMNIGKFVSNTSQLSQTVVPCTARHVLIAIGYAQSTLIGAIYQYTKALFNPRRAQVATLEEVSYVRCTLDEESGPICTLQQYP